MSWHVYILRCANGTLYTGITTCLSRRMEQHNTGKGASYTRAFGPVELEWSARSASQSAALKREARIKKLSRKEKEEFIIKHKN
jgi:putative endonuclease